MREVVVMAGGGSSVENPVGGVLTFKITSDASGGSLTALETIAARGRVHRFTSTMKTN